MIRKLVAATLALLVAAGSASAGDRTFLGYGRVVNNDLFGDTRDRWQTGNVASSRVWGPEWTGQVPAKPGEILELRFNGGIVAPSNQADPDEGDRPFAGYLSFGLHTHFQMAGNQMSVGSDLVVTGPQTRLDEAQTALHDALGIYTMSDATRDTQIGNAVHPTFVAEVGRDLALGDKVTLRPFGETRVGVESLVRLGVDVTLGELSVGNLLIREPVTGQRYRAVGAGDPGYSLVLGGDIAQVSNSVFLPEDRGFELTDNRSRLRAGLHWQSGAGSVFYGVTYLSEEFVGQPEGQVVGSIRLALEF